MASVRSSSEHPDHDISSVNFCFLNPAWMPEWFWLPTAKAVAESGADYFIPPIRRDTSDATIEDNVDIIEAAMQDLPAQYIVALSRGVEYAVRYIDRMSRKGRLQKLIGCTVISSVGPKGYESKLHGFGTVSQRHTANYLAGITHDTNGLEVLDPDVARSCMLHDIQDMRLKEEVIGALMKSRPLTLAEIESVPGIEPDQLAMAWYIGRNDRVDRQEVSSEMARQIFRIEPAFTGWGHVGPLTHTDEVVGALLGDAERAAEKGYRS